MGLIVRTPYVPNADITAEGQNDNENLVANEFNGNIDNANIKLNAGILGTKLAAAPNGIQTDRLNDNAVTTAKIADGAVTSGKIINDAVDSNKLKDDTTIDANRAVTTDHIRDGAVTAAKISAIPNDSVIAAKVKVLTFSSVIPNGLFAQSLINTSLGNTVLPILAYLEGPTPSGNELYMSIHVWWNTSTNTWYLSVFIDQVFAPTSISGVTAKLRYITAS